ncbi:hypothetical protein [Paracoccus sp. (in: a-proteobacteria)]|uniref:hypothetical protein n=1 Tax=Paracoccus sp. TaxID=267 RepID=UPI003A8AF3BC
MTYQPLECSSTALSHQREWTRTSRNRLADGTPCAFVSADTPHEIFHHFDIPVVVNQWWSSVIAAKILATRHPDLTQRQIKGMIPILETLTGRAFDPECDAAPVASGLGLGASHAARVCGSIHRSIARSRNWVRPSSGQSTCPLQPMAISAAITEIRRAGRSSCHA